MCTYKVVNGQFEKSGTVNFQMLPRITIRITGLESGTTYNVEVQRRGGGELSTFRPGDCHYHYQRYDND